MVESIFFFPTFLSLSDPDEIEQYDLDTVQHNIQWTTFRATCTQTFLVLNQIKNFYLICLKKLVKNSAQELILKE